MPGYRELREALGGEISGGEATKARMEQQALALRRVLDEPEIQAAVERYGRTNGPGSVASRVGADGVGITCRILDICLLADGGDRLLPRHPMTVFHGTTGTPNYERDELGQLPEGQALLSIRMIPPQPNLRGVTAEDGGLRGRYGEPAPPEYQFYLERRGKPAPDKPEEIPSQLAGLVIPTDIMHGALVTVRAVKQ
ncbi:MAG: hypothetical protein ABH834_05970, partial [Candidatus Altiarchaeota archaeon]